MLQTRVKGRVVLLLLAAQFASGAACNGSRGSAGSAAGTGAVPAALGLQPGDLVIVDADAGTPVAPGAAPPTPPSPPAAAAAPPAERRGLLFRAAATADGWSRPEILAADERWLEPVDALILPDRTLLVLEQQWRGEGESRGAIFHVTRRDAPADLWWTDPRLRQPVALVRAADGTLYVSDRGADPLGLQRKTGCVFQVTTRHEGAAPAAAPSAAPAGPPADAGTPEAATVFIAGPELVTPGALLIRATDGHLLVLDADANPHHIMQPNGLPDTPGVLYEVRDGKLAPLIEPEETTSPIALIERRTGEIYVVDANAGDQPGIMGDGAIFRVDGDHLRLVLDSVTLHKPRALVDPVGGDTLPDGRLVIADANADPLGLGEDGTRKGVYGTGRGAIVVVDPDAASLVTLIADERFVSPLCVRRVRP